MDIYHLHQEAEPSDRTALQAVVDHIEAEVARLNALEEHIMMEYGPEDERLQVAILFHLLSRHWRHRAALAHLCPCLNLLCAIFTRLHEGMRQVARICMAAIEAKLQPQSAKGTVKLCMQQQCNSG